MKGNIIMVLLVFLIVLSALGGVYYIFNQQSGVISKSIQDLKAEVGALSTTVRILDAQSKGYSDRLNVVETRVNSSDAEKQSLVTRMDAIEKSLEEMKGKKEVSAPVASVAPATPAEEPASTVNLGEIPVQK